MSLALLCIREEPEFTAPECGLTDTQMRRLYALIKVLMGARRWSLVASMHQIEQEIAPNIEEQLQTTSYAEILENL